MKQAHRPLSVQTTGRALYEITDKVQAILAQSGVAAGLVTVFVRHTSCSLLLQENADPDVKRDLQTFFSRIAPEGMDFIVHKSEGADDMPAHIRAALTQTSVAIPVLDGRMVLGAWQGIYLFEHRIRPQTRSVVVHVIGEEA